VEQSEKRRVIERPAPMTVITAKNGTAHVRSWCVVIGVALINAASKTKGLLSA
jgi:hypothetical protein